MKPIHTVETGHDLVVALEGSEWDGFCFNCVVEFIEQKLSSKEGNLEEPFQLLGKCLEDMDSVYNIEFVVDYVFKRMFAAVAGASSDLAESMVETLWSTFYPLVVTKLAERPNLMQLALPQESVNIGDGSSVWLLFFQLKIFRCCKADKSWVDTLAHHLWEPVLMKAMSNRDSGVGATLGLFVVALRMEAVRCVAMLPDRAKPSPTVDDAVLASALLTELNCDYTALLASHSNLSILADLSMYEYRCGLFRCVVRLLRRATDTSEAAVDEGETQTWRGKAIAAASRLMDCFISQQQPRCALTQVVHLAVALRPGAEGSKGSSEGLECICALLRLAATLGSATATHVASRLLAEDCNCGSKLFGVLEQTSLQQDRCDGGGAAAAPDVDTVQLCSSVLLLLAQGCPARYFHYSLFTHSVRTTLFQRYLDSLRRLVGGRLRRSLLPALGHAGGSAATTRRDPFSSPPSTAAPTLQSLLVCAAQNQAIPAETAACMLADLAAILGGGVALLGLAANCLPLVEALAGRLGPEHGCVLGECLSLVCGVLARAVGAVPPLRRLQGTSREELVTALLACLRCVAACDPAEGDRGAHWTSAAHESLACVVDYLSVHLLHDEDHCHPHNSFGGEGDDLFVALLAALATPGLMPMHCPAWRHRQLHSSLAHCYLLRATSASTLRVRSRFDAVYASFLLCTGQGGTGGREELGHYQREAVCDDLAVVIRVLCADRDSNVRASFDAARAVQVLETLPFSCSEGKGNALRSLCFYLQACLEERISATTHLLIVSTSSTSIESPRSASPHVLSTRAAGWAVQGLALSRDPVALSAQQEYFTAHLLAKEEREDDRWTLSAYKEVVFTYAVLFLSTTSGSSLLQAMWALLHRCDKAALLRYWQSCTSVTSTTHTPDLTVSEAVHARLVRLAAATCSAAAGNQGVDGEALRAVQDLEQSIAVKTVAALHSLCEALDGAMAGTAGRSACPQLLVFLLRTLSRLLDASLVLRGAGERVCECAARVLQWARSEAETETEAASPTLASVQACGMKLFTTAFSQRLRAGLLAASVGKGTCGEARAVLETANRAACEYTTTYANI